MINTNQPFDINKDTELSLLAGDPIKLNKFITLTIPTLQDIKDISEEEYNGAIMQMCATSYDIKLYLYNLDIDYEEINDYDTFLMLYRNIPSKIYNLLLNVDLSIGELVEVKDTISIKVNGNIVFDKLTYSLLVNTIRKAHGIERSYKKAGNKYTKQFYIDEDKRNLNKEFKHKSSIAPVISSMVNTEGFKYDYSTVWNLTMYQLIDAVKRMGVINNYKNIMTGVYTGNIVYSSVSKKELNWLQRLE